MNDIPLIQDDQSLNSSPVRERKNVLRILEASFWIVLILATIIAFVKINRLYTFWNDEIYTCHMIQRSFSQIFHDTSKDAHPPLYYYALKIWMGFFERLGFEQHVTIGRWFSYVGFLFGVFNCRFLLTKYLGYVKAVLISTMIMILPAWYDSVDDMRNYAWVMSLALVAGIAYVWILDQRNDEDFSTKKSFFLWSIFTVCMSIAWWMHILVGLTLFWFGIVWVYFSLKDFFIYKKLFKSSYFIHGALSFILLLITYIPWILVLDDQLGYITFVDLSWMTSPTVPHFLASIYFTLSMGRLSWGLYVGYVPFVQYSVMFIFCLAFLYSVGSFIYQRANQRVKIHLFVSGVLISVGYFYTLWCLTIWDVVSIFHGPRYGLPLIPFFGFILIKTSLDFLFTTNSRNHKCLFFFCVIPWILLMLISSIATMYQSLPGRVREWIPQTIKENVPPGKTIYIGPDQVADIWDDFVPLHHLIPLSELSLDDYPEDEEFYFLFASIPYEDKDKLRFFYLHTIDKARDHIELVSGDDHFYGMVVMDRFDKEAMAPILAESPPDPVSSYPSFPKDAIKSLGAYELDNLDGWGVIEMDKHRSLYRWGIEEEMIIQYDVELEPGKYSFNLIGYRLGLHPDQTKLVVEIGEAKKEFDLTSDGIDVEVKFGTTKKMKIDKIILRHPTVIPAHKSHESEDYRTLSILYNGSWIEPLD